MATTSLAITSGVRIGFHKDTQVHIFYRVKNAPGPPRSSPDAAPKIMRSQARELVREEARSEANKLMFDTMRENK